MANWQLFPFRLPQHKLYVTNAVIFCQRKNNPAKECRIWLHQNEKLFAQSDSIPMRIPAVCHDFHFFISFFVPFFEFCPNSCLSFLWQSFPVFATMVLRHDCAASPDLPVTGRQSPGYRLYQEISLSEHSVPAWKTLPFLSLSLPFFKIMPANFPLRKDVQYGRIFNVHQRKTH